MLVVNRREGEGVVVTTPDAQIVIAIVGLKGDRVRLGVEAPPHVRIVREEVFERELFEQEQARAQ